MHDDTWEAFTRAGVRVELDAGPRRLEPRRPGDVGAFPFAAPVHIVTAYNPSGIESSLDRNEAHHARLLAELGDRRVLPTVGSAVDGTMAEPGCAILDIELDEGIGIGARFGQRAIYRWSAGELVVVGVDEAGRTAMGWTLTAC